MSITTILALASSYINPSAERERNYQEYKNKRRQQKNLSDSKVRSLCEVFYSKTATPEQKQKAKSMLKESGVTKREMKRYK